MARRTSLSDLLAGEELEESTEPAHGSGPTWAYLSQLAHNPFNPREELTDLEETAASLREKGQIQPVSVVTKGAFLAVHPDQVDTLGDALYVVIEGNRRLASARLAGLDGLRIDINDKLAESAEDLIEAALVANVHRVDVPPMEQAKGIHKLVRRHGSQAKVARRLGKTEAWVSQRLNLLGLTPELQSKVDAGDLKVEDARRIGRLSADEQADAAEKALNAVKAPRQRAKGTAAGSSEDGRGLNAVKAGSEAEPETGGPEEGLNAVKAPGASSVTEPGGGSAGRSTAAKVPQQAAPEADPVAEVVKELMRLTEDVDGLADALFLHLPTGMSESLMAKLGERMG